MNRVRIARAIVDPVDLAGVIARVDGFIRDGSPHYNVAINAAKVVACEHDAALRAAVEGAHLATADGQAVVWAARLLGAAVPARIAGADLMEHLIAHAADRGHALYFLGARREVVAACVRRARARHPAVRIAGARDGYFTDEDEVVAAIRAARPDIVFVGFESPAKESFMHRRHRDLGAPFVMGVGGAFDVYAGRVRRAPRWLQRAGLEWAFRVAQEPRRLGPRYFAGNARFVALVARELARQGRA